MPEPAESSTRVLTWNLERKRPDEALGTAAIDHLLEQAPDVMALTEVRTETASGSGHALWSSPPRGSWFAENERKVMIWSKCPWRDIDRELVDGLDQTRFVAATTDTPSGPLRVIGVCIPWHMAEVTYPIDQKRRPWELHVRFLEKLEVVLAASSVPTVVAGDFNQRIPRVKYGNKVAAQALASTFSGFDVSTHGTPPGGTRPGIDHIAISPELVANQVWGWPNVIDGRRLSDHEGAGVDLVQR